MPRSSTLFDACEPLSVTSHENARRSMICAVRLISCPEFCVEPTFLSGLSSDAADDGARGTWISASCVFFKYAV